MIYFSFHQQAGSHTAAACFSAARSLRQTRHLCRELPRAWWKETVKRLGQDRLVVDGQPLSRQFKEVWCLPDRTAHVVTARFAHLNDVLWAAVNQLGAVCILCDARHFPNRKALWHPPSLVDDVFVVMVPALCRRCYKRLERRGATIETALVEKIQEAARLLAQKESE